MKKNMSQYEVAAQKRSVFIEQAPVGLLAIAQHAVDNGLTGIWSVELLDDLQVIRVRVFGGEVGTRAWLNTLAIDGEHNEELGSPFGPAARRRGLKTTWQVRLPVGVRFELVEFRELPMLAVVGESE